MSHVNKNQRALLIVTCLVEHGLSKAAFQTLYGWLEDRSVKTAEKRLSDDYRTVIVLQGATADKETFISELARLTRIHGILAVDLILILHGGRGAVWFNDGRISTSDLAEEIRKKMDSQHRQKLRLLYNLSCHGDTHSDDFGKAGFKVRVGSKKINASAGIEYPAFCRHWGNGRTVLEVVRRSDSSIPRRSQDRIASLVMADSSRSDVDSKKVIRGRNTLTISTMR